MKICVNCKRKLTEDKFYDISCDSCCCNLILSSNPDICKECDKRITLMLLVYGIIIVILILFPIFILPLIIKR